MPFPMEKFFKFRDPHINLEGYTLIIPCVSLGNIPQLTVDLLITSLGLTKIGIGWHYGIIPLVGPNPYEESGEACTACEVYYKEDMKLAVMQVRSGFIHRTVECICKWMKDDLQKLKIKDVIVLTSSFDYELHSVGGGKFYYISNSNVSDLMTGLNVSPKERENNGKYHIHGPGYAVELFDAFGNAFKATVLIKFASEGDNCPDAHQMFEMLTKIVPCLAGFPLKDVKTPISWNRMFGPPPPESMF